MNGLDDQRLNPLCELKQAGMDLKHHTNNAGQEMFTQLSEKRQAGIDLRHPHNRVEDETQYHVKPTND